MVQKLNRLFGRVDFRVLSILAVLALFVTIGWTFAQFSDDFNKVSSYEELMARYLDYREHSYMLAVPSWYLYDDQVEALESTYGLEIFQTQSDWYFNFNVGDYYISPKSALAELVEHGTKLIIYEDMVSGELLMVRDTGTNYEEEIVFNAPDWPELGKGDTSAAYLYRELSKRRVVWHVTLKDAKLAEEEFTAMLAAQEEEFEGGSMMMLMGGGEELFISSIRRTNGTAITINYPSDFTNRLDVFTCTDLTEEIWQLAVGFVNSTGTTSTTATDTNVWPGPIWRMYTAGNADLDTDGDGYSDVREVLMYRTDYENAASHPVSVSGSIVYGGTETGKVYMLAVTSSGSWSMALHSAIPHPGGFTNNSVALEGNYWFKAFRDINGNFGWDAWEPWGRYQTNSYNVTGNVSGINITMSNVPSVWGAVNYAGSATGNVYVIAVTSSNSWSTTNSVFVPWDQGSQSETGGTLYLSFPINYGVVGMPSSNYWIKAFIDSSGDGKYNPGEEGGLYALSSIPVSNRVTGINFEIAEDTDEDDLADWWEWQNFGDLDEDAEDDPDSDGLDNYNEYLNGTNPNNSDTDGDGFTDGYEVTQNTDPLNIAHIPELFMVINNDAEYANDTNVLIRFPGYLADTAIISEQSNLSNAINLSYADPMPYSLSGDSNGVRHLYAKLIRNSVTSSLIEGSIIFDTVPPELGGFSPTNGQTTNLRWIKITGVATDALSQVRVYVNDMWVHGHTITSFWHDRILLHQGTNLLVIIAQDMAGNANTQSVEIIQNTEGDTIAPSLSISLPGQTETTNGIIARYGNYPSLYFRGITDDETAQVLTYNIYNSITNGPGEAVVTSTQVWGNVDLEPGTNMVLVTASDAAGNSTSILRVVVRDTNFFFEITSPAHYQVMNTASTVVSGIASPMFLNATITVNGVATTITDYGSNVVFTTGSGVPLNVDRTELIGIAHLNESTFFTDPHPTGYEIINIDIDWGHTWDYLLVYSPCLGQETHTYSHTRRRWSAADKIYRYTHEYEQYSHCFFYCVGPSPVCYDPLSSDTSQYMQVPNFTLYFGATDEFRHGIPLEDHIRYFLRNIDFRFKKRWPTQEIQTVVLQFPDMRMLSEMPVFPFGDSPIEDPSLITYRGQTGFWHNGNVSFIVPIETEVEYSINETDFTWPRFRGSDSFSTLIGRTLSFKPMISNDVLAVKLKELSFDGDKYHIVKSDDGNQDYDAPHWQDNSSPLDGDADDSVDKKYPIAFTRNTKMKVSATWRIEPAGLNLAVKIKGDGPGNLDFPETVAEINGDEVSITNLECLNAFVNEVDFFDPMMIKWFFSVDGGTTWSSAGASENQVYVTLDDPQGTRHHTLLHLGCKNAEGMATEEDVFSTIWNEFTDRDVRRVDGTLLTYYANSNLNVTTASLLLEADGQCVAWQLFFRDLLRVQGITSGEEKDIWPLTKFVFNNNDELYAGLVHHGFFIKSWQFSYPVSYAEDTNINWIDDDYEDDSDPGIAYTLTSKFWLYPYDDSQGSQFIDNAGIGGQGNTNPDSRFSFHALIKYDGKYYDPSYGTSYDSLLEWQQSNVEGFWFDGITALEGGPIMNPNELQIQEGQY